MKREELKPLLEACTTLDELYALAASLGYKEGWARHIWESRGNRVDDPGPASE